MLLKIKTHKVKNHWHLMRVIYVAQSKHDLLFFDNGTPSMYVLYISNNNFSIGVSIN